MSIENIHILCRIVKGPESKENPMGRLYTIYNKTGCWLMLRLLDPTPQEKDHNRFDHIPEIDLRRTFELMHPEEITVEENHITYGDVYHAKE